jgi:hypothetical protein
VNLRQVSSVRADALSVYDDTITDEVCLALFVVACPVLWLRADCLWRVCRRRVVLQKLLEPLWPISKFSQERIKCGATMFNAGGLLVAARAAAAPRRASHASVVAAV